MNYDRPDLLIPETALPETTETMPVESAVVWVGNGKPVNTRKGPGKHYGLSKAGKLDVGTEVEILSRKGNWDQIRCTDRNGASWIFWMMDEFLRQLKQRDLIRGKCFIQYRCRTCRKRRRRSFCRSIPARKSLNRKDELDGLGDDSCGGDYCRLCFSGRLYQQPEAGSAGGLPVGEDGSEGGSA